MSSSKSSTAVPGGLVMARKDQPGKPWLAEVYKTDRAPRQRKSFTSKAAAEAWITRRVKQRLADPTGLRTDHGRVTVRAWMEQFQGNQRHWSANTRRLHVGRLTNQIGPAIGEVPVIDLEHQQVQDLVDLLQAQGLSVASQRMVIGTLNAALAAAVRQGLIPASPAAGITFTPEPRRRVKVITTEQLRAIAAAMPEPYRTLVWLGAHSGMRASEMIALTPDRITFHKDGSAHILIDRQLDRRSPAAHPRFLPLKARLVGDSREIDVPAVMARMLQERIAERPEMRRGDLIFVGERGTRISLSTLGNQWTIATRDMEGIPAGAWHLLRHWHVSNALKAGVPVTDVAEQVGHASAQITMSIYAHAVEGRQGRITQAISEVLEAG